MLKIHPTYLCYFLGDRLLSLNLDHHQIKTQIQSNDQKSSTVPRLTWFWSFQRQSFNSQSFGWLYRGFW